MQMDEKTKESTISVLEAFTEMFTDESDQQWYKLLEKSIEELKKIEN